jgi:hypothetical protein
MVNLAAIRLLKFYICLITFSWCINESGFSQSKWVLNTYANFGCNVWLHYGKKQRFPGFRIFGALSITGTYKDHFVLHYGPSVSIYTKTIGANLNPLVGDYQVDFTNSFSIGGALGKDMLYFKQLRTLHNGDFYNLVTNKRDALFLTSNFILNNHNRHQVTGAVTGTFGDVSVTYNNDATPFDMLGLSDGFDRYWTGGGTLFVHTPQQFNRVEFGYDQFTGYKPLLYELSGILGINIPLYGDEAAKRKHTPNTYNTSIYHLKIGLGEFSSIDVGFVGALIDRKGRFWGIQDWIHLKGNYPFHPNKDNTRFFIGGTYNNLQYIAK